ncbi:MAG: EAL domain-containing protein [Chloroflexi bacterium]|nr:EAL domain-containing protein [Chloroflexota bacterium]
MAICTMSAAFLVVWYRPLAAAPVAKATTVFTFSGLLVVAAVAAYQFPLHLSHHTKVYLSSVPHYVLAVLVTPPAAAAASGAAVLLGEVSVNRKRGNYPSDIATQVGRRMVVVYLGSLVAHLDGGPRLRMAALIGAAVVLLVGDILTWPLVLTPMTGERPLTVVRLTARESGALEAAQYLLGLLAALGAMQEFWAMTVLALPMVLVHQAFRSSARARDAQRAAEEAESRARAAQAAAEESELLKGAILRTALDAIITFDQQGAILEFNPAAELLFGCRRNDAARDHIADYLVHPAFGSDALDGLQQMLGTPENPDGRREELLAHRADGREVPVELTLARLPIDPPLYTAFLRDITAQRDAQEALRYQALHDSLTGLPNRALLRDRLHQAIVTALRRRTTIALLLLDLDRFKEVNDTFGHQAGDALLHDFGARLQQAVRESDTVARLGGDEFAVVLPFNDLAGALHVVHKIQDTLNHPVVVEEQQLIMRASIGVALCPEHGKDGSTLMRRADIAMYTAKRSQQGYAVYASHQDIYSRNRLGLITDLQRAIARGELVLHYQPIVSLRTGQATSVEALVRWAHPVRGLIPPDDFIPLIEETGLVEPLTRWVIDAALRQWQEWHSDGLDLSVAFNLSAHALRHTELGKEIEGLVQTRRGRVSLLHMELTESSLMADPDWATSTLQPLHALGIRISIDDFGTGYSSLARLKHLPVDEIKIDRTFVQNMVHDRDDAAIVQSVVDLAHNLGLTVVAEGCEDRATWDLLRETGCDLVQGYYVSRPLPAADLRLWLNRQQFRLVKEAN